MPCGVLSAEIPIMRYDPAAPPLAVGQRARRGRLSWAVGTSTLILLVGALAWLYRAELTCLTAKPPPSELTAPPVPDPVTYAVLVDEIDYHRTKLANKYHAAETDVERKVVLQSAKNLLELTMPQMMSCWLGTPWDFNGTASSPGAGKVACGYFVSTVMRDAGFDVHRIRLAQQPSQNILRTFLPRNQLKITVAVNYNNYMQSMRKRPHGIYIIGLDRHVGFIVHNAAGLRFIHSGGATHRVVNESESDAQSIRHSRYRVIGNLTANAELLRKWLLQEPFPTQS